MKNSNSCFSRKEKNHCVKACYRFDGEHIISLEYSFDSEDLALAFVTLLNAADVGVITSKDCVGIKKSGRDHD